MGDAVDEALRVKRHHQAHRAEPEECRDAEGQTAEERYRQQRNLHPSPEAVLTLVQIGAPAVERYLAGLPQPAQMSPPEAADRRAGDVFQRLDLRMVLPVVRGPRIGRAGTVEHGEEDEQ